MKMIAPTLLDIGRLSSVLHGISLSDSWKITSSKGDDVIWNVVVAYLNSFSRLNDNELTERIKCLTGDQKVNDSIKTSVEIYDPFLNLKECFKNEEISELVSIFKARVENYLNKNETQFQDELKNFRYLEASSKLLSCNIVHISFPLPDKVMAVVFPVQTSPNLRTIYPKHISIFDSFKCTKGIGNMQTQFSFCIPKEIGIEKQRWALKKTLKCMNRKYIKEKTILKISELPDITENFLISLLKNNFGEVVPFIFKSSYALLRLANAGLETDPRAKDSTDKSAFFYAFKTEKLDLATLFYDEVASRYLQTDASILSPDPVIVENLLHLKDYLKLLGKNLESEEISKNSRCLFEELCRFNDFLIETYKSINNISLKINYYDHTEKEYEILQRKEVILTILNIYKSYFDYTNGETCTEKDKTISCFIEFYKHKNYFDKLDFSSAVIFFDNLFLLKERLKLPNNAYLDIESNLLKFIFLRKFLEQYKKPEGSYFVSRWIAFQERLSLHSQVCSFKEILEKTELSNDNMVYNIPETTVGPLTNLPEIYGQFLINRLQHHLNAATGGVVIDLKSILVIERCLQVLAECCKESDFNYVQRILALSLPKDFIKYLKQISNHFGQTESDEILRRNNLHQDLELFKGIQNELDKLKELLLPIYSAQKYEMDQFLLLHSLKSVCKARRRNIWGKHENLLKAILPSPEMEENHFDDMYKSLKEEIIEINRNLRILNESTASRYKHVIQNMISAMREVLDNRKDGFLEKVPDQQEAIEELDSHFWCLENILTFITKDQKLAKYRRTLVLMLKDRKSLFTGIRKNAFEHQYQKKKKSTNAVIDDDPVAHAVGNESQQSSQPEEAGNSCQQNLMDIYLKFGTLFNPESGSSTLAIENEDNRSSHKEVESSETENEINGENLESSILQNILHGSVSQETIPSKDCEEVDDLCENAEKVITDENYLPLAETISMPSSDDWLLANVYHDYPVNDDVEDPVEIIELERKTFLELAATCLDNYKKIADSLFLEFPDSSQEDFHFRNIEKYCSILKNVEGEKISPGCVLKSCTNLELELIDDGTHFSDTELAAMIELKGIEESELFVQELEIPEDLSNIFSIVKSKCKISEKPDHSKDIGLKVEPAQKMSTPGHLFECLRNRIKLLKSILIHEKEDIAELWERATDQKGKMHVKEKIVQLYLNNSETQVSVEMLFFDCFTILNSKEVQNLRKKATNLIGGMNLRNSLVHGQPQLGSLGKLLDPYGVPSELVGKILQLISDENTIDCMQKILEQSGSDFPGFVQIMKDEKTEEFKNLREQILECDHWKEYALLIPFAKE